MITLYSSTGILRYQYEQYGYGYRLVVDIDQAIADYYRSLIPKWIDTNKQMYPAHISVVRKETPNDKFWGRYEGEEIEFYYSPTIHSGKVYYWLNCFCKRLEGIRLELELPVSSEYTRPPNGWVKCFHCTIANNKGITSA